ncbi:hypothetical protein OHD05_04780 [Escherichia coli]|nr:hypothetical protein [Escherichia coli]MCW7306498.1 hypothetical protein [Escherichia coli]
MAIFTRPLAWSREEVKIMCRIERVNDPVLTTLTTTLSDVGFFVDRQNRPQFSRTGLLHRVFAIQHGIYRLHFFHPDNGVLFLFEVISDDTQTTVGWVVQLSRTFSPGRRSTALLVINCVSA